MSEQSGQESVLREEIIRMAQESGLSLGHSFAWSNLERFAALVATAKEQQMRADGWRHCAQGQRTTQFCGLTEHAIAAEREACIRICTEVARIETQQFALDGAVAAHECAQRIRERGEV